MNFVKIDAVSDIILKYINIFVTIILTFIARIRYNSVQFTVTKLLSICNIVNTEARVALLASRGKIN